ncbi:TPA: hypothetical protein ACGO0I_001441 [Streptococcus suis]
MNKKVIISTLGIASTTLALSGITAQAEEVTSIMGLIGIGLMGLAPKARKRK